jgi:hypothetical protein
MNQDRPCPINVGSSNCFWTIWKILLSYCYVLKKTNVKIFISKNWRKKKEGPSGVDERTKFECPAMDFPGQGFPGDTILAEGSILTSMLTRGRRK